MIGGGGGGGGGFVVVLVMIITSLLPEQASSSSSDSSPPAENMVKPGCTNFTCGNMKVIPYPFGMEEDCYATTWFSIYCNHSFNPAKPFLNHPPLRHLEVLNITLQEYGTVIVRSPILSSTFCSNNSHDHHPTSNGTDLSRSPFWFSARDNLFMVLGCGSARLINQTNDIIAGCASNCADPDGSHDSDLDSYQCFGDNCCRTLISFTSGRSVIFRNYSVSYTPQGNVSSSRCAIIRAFMVGRNFWISGNFSSRDVIETGHAPMEIYWGINKDDGYANIHCPCDDLLSSACHCRSGTEGNPFLKNGCRAVKECSHCLGTCDSAYNSSTGASYYYCNTKNRERALILGFCLGGGLLVVLLGSLALYKVVKKKREIRRKRRFFKRNGGILLEQQFSSDNGALEKTKIFTSKELEKATDNFNLNRIIGQGGQGTVYKGMLSDGRIVAIKRSKIVDESQVEHFINEIVILSQINHRNVVGLLGCCLETEVPSLVYEFISNGNLFQLIHNDQDSDFLLSWKMLLQIATEVAGALAYLHSACSIPIYHRDIKSTNILLDDKYRAKVSDFGISRSVAIEQTHLTTAVQGTFGYLDPEYFQSSQYTEKSDVYSFGVVLAELLTGQKPICSTRSQEEKSLATHFILLLQESRLFDNLDVRVVKEGSKEEVLAFAHLAYRCLDLNGKKRPTMKEVTLELERIKMSLQPLEIEKKIEENAYMVAEFSGPLDGTPSSTASYSDSNKACFSETMSSHFLHYTL